MLSDEHFDLSDGGLRLVQKEQPEIKCFLLFIAFDWIAPTSMLWRLLVAVAASPPMR